MKQTIYKITTAITGLALLSGAVLPSFAQAAVNVGVNLNANASATVGGAGVGAGAGVNAGASVKTAALLARIQTAQERADQEIKRRIDALTQLSTWITNIVKLASSSKDTLNATITAQIAAMNTLQAQIASDVTAESTSSLKTDIQSITKSYRIYMLIIPQGRIDASAGRLLDIADAFTTLAGQLQTRITDAQNAGNNMSAAVTALADMNAKIADANVQANAAVNGIAGLQPDNGLQSVMQANLAALKAARAKVQAGQQDIVAARKDAGAIVKALLAIKVSGNANASGTVSGNGNASGTENASSSEQ